MKKKYIQLSLEKCLKDVKENLQLDLFTNIER